MANLNVLFRFDEDNKIRNAISKITPENCKDRNFALNLVKEDGRALEYLDESLRRDVTVVKQAVTENPYVLILADESVKSRLDVIYAAVGESKDENVLDYAGVRQTVSEAYSDFDTFLSQYPTDVAESRTDICTNTYTSDWEFVDILYRDMNGYHHEYLHYGSKDDSVPDHTYTQDLTLLEAYQHCVGIEDEHGNMITPNVVNADAYKTAVFEYYMDLADRLNNYAQSYDFYDWRDTVEDEDAEVASLMKDLCTGNLDGIKGYISESLSNLDDTDPIYADGEQLLKELENCSIVFPEEEKTTERSSYSKLKDMIEKSDADTVDVSDRSTSIV